MARLALWCLAVSAWLGTIPLPAAEPDRPPQPGRRVNVATIAIGFGGQREQKLRLALEHLEAAGQNGVDIACLPEEFAGTTAETIPGPTTKSVGELAQRYHMYTVCPIREQAADGRQYNTAVLLDRAGRVAGCYRKLFVNEEKLARLLQEHAGEVEVERRFEAEAWRLLRAVKPGVRVQDLCRQYRIETLREYRHRSRQQLNEARRTGEKI